MATVRLKRGREASLLRRHPWIFSGAVERVDGTPGAGDAVTVMGGDGQVLGEGSWSPHSQIRVRMWHFHPETRFGPDFVLRRLERAIAKRRENLENAGEACRLVYGEADGFPGLIVDRYDDVLVLQALSVGAERWKETVAGFLADHLDVKTVYERSEGEARQKEGLRVQSRLLRGAEPPEWVEIQENGVRFLVDVRQGHKTGFYLDQRTNRAMVSHLASGSEVLNAFSYSGGFGISALREGARHVVQLDSSSPALELAQKHLTLNHLSEEAAEHTQGDVFQVLRAYRDRGRQFDLIVLDPPKFAESKSQVERAARGYKDINRLAFLLLRPGGRLVTFSCSGAISADLFQKIVASAAVDARVPATIHSRLTQAEDHPVDLHFPESEYLKGLVCRVEDA